MAYERQRFVAESVQQISAAKIFAGRIQLDGPSEAYYDSNYPLGCVECDVPEVSSVIERFCSRLTI